MANGGSGPRAKDPPFAGAFVLEVDGLEIGRFTEVTGLSVTMQVEEVVEGGNNESTVKLPGRLEDAAALLSRTPSQRQGAHPVAPLEVQERSERLTRSTWWACSSAD